VVVGAVETQLQQQHGCEGGERRSMTMRQGRWHVGGGEGGSSTGRFHGPA
jgi:hypothetical protein